MKKIVIAAEDNELGYFGLGFFENDLDVLVCS